MMVVVIGGRAWRVIDRRHPRMIVVVVVAIVTTTTATTMFIITITTMPGGHEGKESRAAAGSRPKSPAPVGASAKREEP